MVTAKLSWWAVGFGIVLAGCGGAESWNLIDGTSAAGDSSEENGKTFTASQENIGPQGTASACVTNKTILNLAPTSLAILMDRSGSMGGTVSGPTAAAALRWIPVTQGLKQFLGGASQQPLRASLQFFPMNDTNIEAACSFAYGRPTVAMTSASDPLLASTMDAMRPSGGTPTLPALTGTVEYAKTLSRKASGEKGVEKVAVVLVTDGEPGFASSDGKLIAGCPNNDVEHIAALAKSALASDPPIMTYVIGVGPKLDALNAIAKAGGTSEAIMVDAANPDRTASEIQGALLKIRAQEASCDFPLPPAPAGQSLDSRAVNVVTTVPHRGEEVLSYNKTCADGAGWTYDAVDNPTRVRLCSKTCSEAKAEGNWSVTLAFGCKTSVYPR